MAMMQVTETLIESLLLDIGTKGRSLRLIGMLESEVGTMKNRVPEKGNAKFYV